MEEVARNAITPAALRWWHIGEDERRRAIAMALLVGGAYYAGARIGSMLLFAPGPTSVLWPPNAILTAALLLTPVHRWWMHVLAVAPAHLLVQIGVVQPPSLIGAFFVTNWSEALVAAAVVRWLGGTPFRLDTLRRTVVFMVGAGFVAPFVSSFIDAAAVTTLSGEEYWRVWRTRFFANVVTELALASTIVAALTSSSRWRDLGLRRRAEAVLCALVVLVAGVLVLDSDRAKDAFGLPGDTSVLLLLPALLWAALRFGPVGGSLSVLIVTTVGIWGVRQGLGPFAGLSPDERVIALQVSLIMVTIPLLCVAAVVAEQRLAAATLNESLRFEALLSDLSSSFLRLSAEEIDGAIRTWLERLGEFLALHRLTLLRQSEDGTTREWHSWWAPVSPIGGPPDPQSLSSFALPLVARGRPFGKLIFELPGHPLLRPAHWIHRLTVVAEMLGSALADKDAEEALRASESMKSAILASLSTGVAVLDREGRVIVVNAAWRRFAWDPQLEAEVAGADYLERWRRAEREGDPYAREVITGIQHILDGTLETFTIEYPVRTGGQAAERWWALSVVPLSHSEGGAVIAQADLTARRHAETEAQRMQQELAHFTRVSTMGELTASLAHEINQPLTAILANAQAARRFLNATSPDLNELRAILSEIVDDNRRAGEIIHRLREMLAKRAIEFHPLNVNVLIEDVIKLLRSDLLIHDVTVTSDLAADLPLIEGDRIQLQQVVLNLLLNAIDAMALAADRTIVVRTEWFDSVHVSVSDSGHGLIPGADDLVFHPFYTTKPAGMGMGLAVARSIIDTHGGLIWVTPNPTCGVTFHFAVPLDQRSTRA